MRFSAMVKPLGSTTFTAREVKTGTHTVWNGYDVGVVQSASDVQSDKALQLTATLLTAPDSRNDRILTRYNEYLQRDPKLDIAIKVNTYMEIINRFAYQKPIDAAEDDITAVQSWRAKLSKDYSVPGTGDLHDLILTTGELDIVQPTAFGARQIVTSDSSILRFSPKKDKTGQTLADCNVFTSSQMISYVDVKPVYQDRLVFFDQKGQIAESLETYHGMVGKDIMGCQFMAKLQKSLYNGSPSLALNLTDLHPLWFKGQNKDGIDAVAEGAEVSTTLSAMAPAEDF